MTPLLLSACLAPGAGQFYKRQFIKGSLMLGLCLCGFAWLFLDLCSIVNASLQAEPLLDPSELFDRAVEIRRSFSVWQLTKPVAIILVSYLWGVLDIVWAMRKEKQTKP